MLDVQGVRPLLHNQLIMFTPLRENGVFDGVEAPGLVELEGSIVGQNASRNNHAHRYRSTCTGANIVTSS